MECNEAGIGFGALFSPLTLPPSRKSSCSQEKQEPVRRHPSSRDSHPVLQTRSSAVRLGIVKSVTIPPHGLFRRSRKARSAHGCHSKFLRRNSHRPWQRPQQYGLVGPQRGRNDRRQRRRGRDQRRPRHGRQHQIDPGLRPGRQRHHHDRREQRRDACGEPVRRRRQRYGDRRIWRRHAVRAVRQRHAARQGRQRPVVRWRRRRRAGRRRRQRSDVRRSRQRPHDLESRRRQRPDGRRRRRRHRRGERRQRQRDFHHHGQRRTRALRPGRSGAVLAGHRHHREPRGQCRGR